MNIEHRHLTKHDKSALLEFSSIANHSDELRDWLQKTLDDESRYSIICAEFIDNKLNAIIAACSWSYWMNAKNEHMPMWLGIRTDRLQTTGLFNTFMDKLSTLVATHFERMGYFQHYIVRKLPKRFGDASDIARFTKRAWGQGPYVATVEHIIQNEDDYVMAPKLFKSMIGAYKSPVVVLFMNIIDHKIREQRCNTP